MYRCFLGSALGHAPHVNALITAVSSIWQITGTFGAGLLSPRAPPQPSEQDLEDIQNFDALLKAYFNRITNSVHANGVYSGGSICSWHR